MIRYQLRCGKAHEFEGWFANSAAYDTQAKRGLVSCTHCGSTKVSKAPMAPGIARGGKSPACASDMVETLRRMRRHVARNSEYVGDKFASEALKIHREESEQRGIYGEATRDEVRALHEEGVEFHPLPILPEDHN